MLANYAYYKNDFGGTLIPQADWDHAAEAASDWMHAATFGRLESGIPEEFTRNVKRCCCEIAEQLYSNTLHNCTADGSDLTGAVSHEESGAYSITYRSMSEIASALLHGGESSGLQDLLLQIARKHLGRTGLLYRGVDEP